MNPNVNTMGKLKRMSRDCWAEGMHWISLVIHTFPPEPTTSLNTNYSLFYWIFVFSNGDVSRQLKAW